jgi:alpha-tubulin suppressor-like RCC1 family protein
LILAAMIAALTMAIAASAQAAPNIATAWGNNEHGQLGDGTTEGPEKTCGVEANRACSTTPVAVSGLNGVTAVDAGEQQSLALLENGTVMAWGDPVAFGGSLGDGTTKASDVPVAVCAPAPEPCPGSHLGEVTAIASSRFDNVALLKNGAVMDWGSGLDGALGDGTTEGSSVPVAVSGLSEPVKAIAAGEAFSLALLSNGTVMAWGRNSSGQLGNGTTTSSDVPVEVKGLTGVTAIASGGDFALAVLSNGTVMAWGANGSGQLGNGTETSSDVPVAVSGLKEVTAVAGGGQDGLALLSNGTVKAWGNNTEGELGDGSHTGPENCGTFMLPCAKTPMAVSGLSGVTMIAVGETHSLALLSNGAVVAWGTNHFGQLGDGTSTGPEPCGPFAEPCSTTPVAVKQAAAVVKGISAGRQFSVAFGLPPAPANLPEVGHCVKVAVGTGKYSGAACLTLATKPTAKKYEWVPVSVTEKQAFAGSGLETILTTAGHSTTKCLAANLSGEWTGPKTASVNVEFQACYNAQGQQCQTVTNPQNKSEIKLSGVLGELGYIKYEEVEGKLKIVVGLDLKPQPPMTQLAEYECTGSTETGHLEGSVIGKITPIDTMTTTQNLLYLATKTGEQRPEAFQAGPTDTLITSFTSGTEAKGSGASSLNIKEYKGHNAAPLEIKAK